MSRPLAGRTLRRDGRAKQAPAAAYDSACRRGYRNKAKTCRNSGGYVQDLFTSVVEHWAFPNVKLAGVFT